MPEGRGGGVGICTSQGWLGHQGVRDIGAAWRTPRGPVLPDWRDRPKGPRVWPCAAGTGGPGEGQGVHAGVTLTHSMRARQARTGQAPAHSSQALLPATGQPRTEGPRALSHHSILGAPGAPRIGHLCNSCLSRAQPQCPGGSRMPPSAQGTSWASSFTSARVPTAPNTRVHSTASPLVLWLVRIPGTL